MFALLQCSYTVLHYLLFLSPKQTRNKTQQTLCIYLLIFVCLMQWLISTPTLMSFKVPPLAVFLPYVPPLGAFIYGCNNLKSISGSNQLDYYFQLLLPIDAIPTLQTLTLFLRPWSE